jgi:DNA-binding MltR family transcriptional regulator
VKKRSGKIGKAAEAMLAFSSNEVIEFRISLSPETDRGVALVCAAYLEHELESLLRKYFVDDAKISDSLFEPSGPLGTFSAKIDLILALGVVSPEVHRSLHLVRKIRNEFAHQHRVLSFAHQKIESRCRELVPLNPDPLEKNPRDLFIRASMAILAVLHATEAATIHADKKVGRIDQAVDILRLNYQTLQGAAKKVFSTLNEEDYECLRDPEKRLGFAKGILEQMFREAGDPRKAEQTAKKNKTSGRKP